MDIVNQLESITGETREIGANAQNVTYTNQDVSGVGNVKQALDTLFGGIKIVRMSKSAYDELTTKDPNTLYLIPKS